MTADEVKERRQALGLTQKDLAAQLGVDVTTVARWERGEIKLNPLLDLAMRHLETVGETHKESRKKKTGDMPDREASVKEPGDTPASFVVTSRHLAEPAVATMQLAGQNTRYLPVWLQKLMFWLMGVN